ncbi:transposase family protein [Sciscionella sediminilitoris]|uniref:transposase family protein n=1 Tax=Sciscionella sediminilitoris TaxID=1445613 RepID=UPI0009EC714D
MGLRSRQQQNKSYPPSMLGYVLGMASHSVCDEGGRIVVWARTVDAPVACPGCGADSGRMHGHHWRCVTDLPLDGQPVTVRVQARRLLRPTTVCRRTFREQVSAARRDR